MVTFEISSSPDVERVGETSIFYEHFTLGSARKADIVIEDSALDNIHLSFILNKDGLLVNSTNENFYFSNGKKLKGGKLHKTGDFIKIGETTLKIKALDFKNLSEGFGELYEKRLQENPELESIITQLQKELIYLENNKDV